MVDSFALGKVARLESGATELEHTHRTRYYTMPSTRGFGNPRRVSPRGNTQRMDGGCWSGDGVGIRQPGAAHLSYITIKPTPSKEAPWSSLSLGPASSDDIHHSRWLLIRRHSFSFNLLPSPPPPTICTVKRRLLTYNFIDHSVGNTKR